MISYRKLLKIFDERGITSYTMTRKYRIVGSSTWQKIQSGGNIDTKSIDALCEFLDCQPGDILDYIPNKKDDTHYFISCKHFNLKNIKKFIKKC